MALYEAGTYTATLTYNNGETTTAQWLVRDLETVSKAKNIILFIGVCILSGALSEIVEADLSPGWVCNSRKTKDQESSCIDVA